MFNLNATALTMSALLLAGAGTMNAQDISAYFGLGTAMDSSSNQQIDTFGNGVLYPTPEVTGLFATVGAEYMFSPHFGASGEFNWRTSQGAYAGLQYRPLIYDFGGVWQPIGRSGRIVPEIQAGLGGMDIKYYLNSSTCDQFTGCSSSSQYVESANHVQVHLSAAVRLYVTNHVFLRPAVDAHWVDGLTQFGSNWIPEFSLGVGYSFRGVK
jgi:hypothetical protein